MKKRLRQHVNPLKMSSLLPREEELHLPAGVPVEVELGCGDALFLLDRAASRADRFFIGIDIREPFLEEGREDLSRRGLSNVALLAANLFVDADRLFPPRRVRRFYVNFPDPWFKARQHNRRWLNPEAVAHLSDALEPDGELFFQSDVWDLALEAMGLFESAPRLENRCGEWTFLRRNPFGARSSRELACLEESLQIWRLLFSRRR